MTKPTPARYRPTNRSIYTASLRKRGSVVTSRLRSLISGNTLRCDALEIDRYGRLVAQCLLPDGRNIAAEMIRSGAATEYGSFSRSYHGTC